MKNISYVAPALVAKGSLVARTLSFSSVSHEEGNGLDTATNE